jgi:hypothetical protein
MTGQASNNPCVAKPCSRRCASVRGLHAGLLC